MIEVGSRISEGMNRARLKLELRRSLVPLAWIAGGAVLALMGWSYIADHIGKSVYASSSTIRFVVDDASGVVPGRGEVRFKGIPAGEITDADVVEGKPVLTVKLYSEYGPIYRDARAALRPNTALMDMYVNILDRGTRAAGKATASTPLPARQIDTSVKIADVLQTFDPQVRRRLATMFSQFGGGLEDRGAALRQAFVSVAPFLNVAARASDQLRRRASATRRLVTNFAVLNEELARRDGQLRTLAEAGGRTLRTLEHGSEDLAATLRGLPPTLRGIHSSFSALRGVLPKVDTAVESLKPVAAALPTGLSAVKRFSEAADPAVQALQRPVRRLNPLARALRPLAGNLAASMNALRPQAPAFDHIMRSTAGCSVALYGFFQWTPSVIKLTDERGAYPRGEAVVSIGSSGVARDPNHFPAKNCSPGVPKGSAP